MALNLMQHSCLCCGVRPAGTIPQSNNSASTTYKAGIASHIASNDDEAVTAHGAYAALVSANATPMRHPSQLRRGADGTRGSNTLLWTHAATVAVGEGGCLRRWHPAIWAGHHLAIAKELQASPCLPTLPCPNFFSCTVPLHQVFALLKHILSKQKQWILVFQQLQSTNMEGYTLPKLQFHGSNDIASI